MDDEDGMPEKNMTKSEAYLKARSQMPRFVHPGSFEFTVCARWKELEEQKKQMDNQVKERIELAREQLKIEIEQLSIDHQTYLLREDLARRENELRYLEEQRRQELEQRKNMIQQVIQQHQYDFSSGGTGSSRDLMSGSHSANLFFQGSAGNRMASPSNDDMSSRQQQLAAVYAASKTQDRLHGSFAMNSSQTQFGSHAGNQPLMQSQQYHGFQGSSNCPQSATAHSNLMAAAAVLNSAGLIPSNILQSSAFFQHGSSGNQTALSAAASKSKGYSDDSNQSTGSTPVTSSRNLQQSSPGHVAMSGHSSGQSASSSVDASQRGNFIDHPRKRSRF